MTLVEKGNFIEIIGTEQEIDDYIQMHDVKVGKRKPFKGSQYYVKIKRNDK